MATEKLKYIVTADTKGFITPMKAVAALAVSAFASAVKITAEFEKELSKLKAISGATKEEMVKLEKNARQLGKTTAFTAIEVAGLQVELAKLGFTTNDIINSSGGVLDLAAALGVTLSDSAVLVGSTLKSFNLTTAETARVVDVLALAASSSALDFGKLQESLKIVSPIARATNTSLEETVAILSTLADSGIHGTTAGTALRKILIELNEKGLTLNEAYKLVINSSDKLGASTDLVGKRAAGAFLVMAEGSLATDKLTKSYEGAIGTAEVMRKQMEDNLIGDFDKLKSAISEMAIEVGQTTDGPLRDLTQWFTTLINGSEETLGFVDSLTRAFYYLQESLLLMARASATAQLGFLNLFKLPGQSEVEDRIDRITEKLDALNTKIIKVSDYGGGTSGGEDTSSGATVPGIDGEKFKNDADKLLENSNKVTDGLSIGWATVGASIAGALTAVAGGEQNFGQIAGGLLSAVGGALISIGIAAVAAGKALAIFGIGIPAIAQGYYAIGIGALLVAGGGALSKSSAGGGGSSSSSSQSSSSSSQGATTLTPSSIQGSDQGFRLVSEIRGQDLRVIMQRADDSYSALS